MQRYDFPDRDLAVRSYTHNLWQLVHAARLDVALRAELAGNPMFSAHLELVKSWSEQSRYERHGEHEARALYTAIADPNDGVLRWIRQSW